MLRWRAAALVLLLTGLASAEAQDKPGALVFPVPDRPVAGITSPTYSDEKTRDGHGEAERVMNLLGIMPGQRVADVGAGLGYYTVRLSRRLGLGATIYATDVKDEYLDQLRARLKREHIDGVRTILGRPRDPLLPMNSVDVVILSHMYHEIENPYEFLYRLQPALAPGARVGIIDTDEPTQRHGTPPAPPPVRVGRRRHHGNSTSSSWHLRRLPRHLRPGPKPCPSSKPSHPAGLPVHVQCELQPLLRTSATRCARGYSARLLA
jgi:protein-L-isoaspartate O-methyltransferase